MGAGKSDKGKSDSSTGYSFFHLILVALVALLIGAFSTQKTQGSISSIIDEPATKPVVDTIPE